MPIGSEALISRAQPQGFTDQLIAPPRGSKYRELYVQAMVPDKNALADEGAYFMTNYGTATIGTGVAFGQASVVSFTDTTSAGLVITNTAATGGARIYLDYVRLNLRTAATGPVTTPFEQWLIQTDTNASRYSAGGQTMTPLNVNQDSAQASVALVKGGALTLATATAAKRALYAWQFRHSIPIVVDEYLLTFGSVEKTSFETVAATAGRAWNNVGPCIIGPGQAMSLHRWAPATTNAPIFDVEVGWFER